MTLRAYLRHSFIATGSLIAITGYWGLANLQLTLNGTTSLPEHAYLQWRWPLVLWHGAVVAVTPPEIFHGKLDGMQVVKRAVGFAGDVIVRKGEAVCLPDRCYMPLFEDGKPFAPPIAAGEIPKGQIAIFGDAPDSFDSRYASFGLIPVEDVQAVGVPLDAFPHWTEVAKWLGLSQ